MESQSTPRITAPYLDAYQGRNVIVVGRVVQLRGEAAVIDADGNITAHLNREIPTMQEAHLSNGNAVQIIGKVNPDLSIRALSSLDLGAGVDLNVYQHVVDVSQKHDQLFGAGSTH
ncbi:replication factor A protein 3 [Diaporthe amygdali]|uniref:replication factor A protein 3 n=1 Tax=Phomopsis amygdali TaxID=1214568 RepID=UPI0022FE5698|nr:replication factor A protein 3 [Diaporthe amygdali]KAJ0117139.1 replication factor A protein 3 [Diaporthe amygdali]